MDIHILSCPRVLYLVCVCIHAIYIICIILYPVGGSAGEGPNVVSVRMRGQSLASLSGLRILHCRKLWCS